MNLLRHAGRRSKEVRSHASAVRLRLQSGPFPRPQPRALEEHLAHLVGDLRRLQSQPEHPLRRRVPDRMGREPGVVAVAGDDLARGERPQRGALLSIKAERVKTWQRRLLAVVDRLA